MWCDLSSHKETGQDSQEMLTLYCMCGKYCIQWSVHYKITGLFGNFYPHPTYLIKKCNFMKILGWLGLRQPPPPSWEKFPDNPTIFPYICWDFQWTEAAQPPRPESDRALWQVAGVFSLQETHLLNIVFHLDLAVFLSGFLPDQDNPPLNLQLWTLLVNCICITYA